MKGQVREYGSTSYNIGLEQHAPPTLIFQTFFQGTEVGTFTQAQNNTFVYKHFSDSN